ncbi:biopolymer transporter ExbB [Pseudooceanicola sp. 502str34]|uniref:biopolymer transporter ExbB n=1 Tax=Maritimibacter alkaliphilus TaxID=404236 RepID=UPI0021BD32AB|nr:biopolymer transporter ExbB [Maritimibacter alkaliphilus]
MDQPAREAEPQFSQPVRQILLMLIVLGLTGVVAFFIAPRVLPVFLSNPYLNGLIGFVFVVGVVSCFWQVAQLVSSVRWIEAFASDRLEAEGVQAPRLLAPLATLLRSRSKRMQISSSSSTSILESVVTRIEEQREITRYVVNVLIFLGLLGTFYGLATTVPAVVDTIRSLAPQEGDSGVEVFNRLMTGLEAQLGGMGTAFSSSLLGLAFSLVVGLLELFAGHGQNRFYRELEEWLSSITRVGFAGGESDGQSDQSILATAMDQMVENMQTLVEMNAATDANRAMLDEKLANLADAVERLAYRLGDQNPTQAALLRVAEGQEKLIDRFNRSEAGEGIDAESRMRLRSIDVQMLRILEEISAGRQETMSELRTDIAALSRVVAQSASGQPGARRLGGQVKKPSGQEG